MDPEKFERQMEYMLANHARHDDQIQGLIRLAELQQANLERQQANLERLEDKHTRLEASLERFKAEVQDSIRESRESRKAADERVSQLVSAIGEWIRRSSAQN